MDFAETIEAVGKGVDIAGVAAIILGALMATWILVTRAVAGERGLDAYVRFRRGIGRAILLGLELLVAADIIRTVAVDPSFESLGVLAVIVAIRTFLSFSLQLELEGRGPWQRPAGPEPGQRGGSPS